LIGFELYEGGDQVCRLHGEELDGNEPMYQHGVGSGKNADQKVVNKREENPIYFLPTRIFKKLEAGAKVAGTAGCTGPHRNSVADLQVLNPGTSCPGGQKTRPW